MKAIRLQSIAQAARENMNGYTEDWLSGNMNPANYADTLFENRAEFDELDDEEAGVDYDQYLETIAAEFHGWIKEQGVIFIFQYTPENVRSHNRATSGWEYHGHVKTHQEFYNKVAGWEDQDFFPQDDGRVMDQSGNEVYDPEYPNQFDFGDWDYRLIKAEDLEEKHLFAMAHQS